MPLNRYWMLAFAVALAAVAVLGATSLIRFQALDRAAAQTEQAEATVDLLQSLYRRMLEAETGQRGYLLTGSRAYIEPYESSLNTIDETLQILRETFAGDPGQTARVDALDALVRQKRAELEATVALYASGNAAAAQAMVLAQTNKHVMDEARTIVREMTAIERAGLIRSEARARQTRASSQLIVLFTTALGVLLIIGVVLAGMDIARRQRRLEQEIARGELVSRELAESQKQYKLIFDSARDFAIIATDHQGHVTAWNSGAHNIMGWSPEEVLGQPVAIIFTPEDRHAGAVHLETTTALLDDCAINERWHMRKDGSRFWGSGLVVPMRSDAGETVGFLKIMRDATSQQVASAALAESEERLRTLADNISQFAWMTDERGWIFWYNKRWYDYTGTTFEQMKGWGWRTVHHPDHVDRVVEKYSRCIETGEPWEDVFPLRARDGTYRWFLSRAVPIRDASGAITRWFGTNTDVTEQRRSREELQESEERKAAILASALDCIVTMDEHDRILEFNPAAERTFGYSREEVVGRTVAETLVPEKLRSMHLKGVERYLRTGEARLLNRRIEMPAMRKDGSIVPVELAITPVHLASGKLMFTAYLRDISERKATEHALLDARNRLDTALEAASVGTWTWDIASDRIAMDVLVARMFGFDSAAAAAGIPLSDALRTIHEDDRAQVASAISASLVSGDDYFAEYRIVLAGAPVRWVQARGRLIRDDAGEPVSLVGAVVDITRLVEANAELDRYKQHLERIVAERTTALEESNTRLRLSERLAALGTLSAGLGHDMGNLLLPLRMRVEALEERQPPLEDDVRKDLAAIGEAAEYLQRLVKGLRLLAVDPEAGAASDESVELCDWWRDTAALLRNTLPPRALIEADVARGTPPVRIGRAALTQAVFNVVQNAGDALRSANTNPAGVYIRARPLGGTVVLEIQDNGPGMTPDVRDRALEPFFTTKPRERSTGMGLALVAGLIGRAHGQVEIESTPGRGSTIRFILPRAPDGEGREPETRSAVTQPSALVRMADPRRQAFVESALRTVGFKTAGAENGATLLIADAAALGGPAPALSTAASFTQSATPEQPRMAVLAGIAPGLAGGGPAASARRGANIVGVPSDPLSTLRSAVLAAARSIRRPQPPQPPEAAEAPDAADTGSPSA